VELKSHVCRCLVVKSSHISVRSGGFKPSLNGRSYIRYAALRCAGKTLVVCLIAQRSSAQSTCERPLHEHNEGVKLVALPVSKFNQSELCSVAESGQNCTQTRYETIRYDTRCYFSVRSKANISQLNLPQGNNN